MKLNQQLAQKIVQRTMKIIGYSVNVMDETGTIIASGDFHRVGQSHIGAVIVLRENRMVEINQTLAQQWQHQVKQGINLPIRYLNQLIGVIGISGEPDKVRHYVELAKMATELIVEQAVIQERQQWHKRYKEEFLLQLLNGTGDLATLRQQSTLFTFEPQQTRRVIVIKLLHSSPEYLQEFINHLEQIGFTDYAVINLTQIALLQHIHSMEQANHQLNKQLPQQNKQRYKVAIGSVCTQFEDLHISYQTAQNILAYGLAMRPKQHYYFFDQHSLPALLFNLMDTWYMQKILQHSEKLKQQDHKKVLLKTLQQYFLANCDLDRTAQKLFIHPNTLRYRLARIEQITSLKINNIEDKFNLYLCALLS